jgi:hypothetical protein
MTFTDWKNCVMLYIIKYYFTLYIKLRRSLTGQWRSDEYHHKRSVEGVDILFDLFHFSG